MVQISDDTTPQCDAWEDLTSAVNHRKWLCSLARPHFGEDVLEIGSGAGHHAAEWADMGVRITASEADRRRVDALRERFARDARVTVRELVVPIAGTADYSTVVAVNVLEHIEDDVGALRSFANVLRHGGSVVLVVPAFEFAMSEFGRAVGHHRRYRTASLARALTKAGLQVTHCRYLDGPGLLGWYVARRLLGRWPRRGLAQSAYDAVCVPIERRIETRFGVPFGQSVFAVARRP
ncbi:methyltransferase domain-containing protein [Saccharopolyspora rhizosphaerae]|uniref:Methyltransferase domain-containing protein n=1 Tax=Saccharopolyspora rhizosphaerae TaxID=2492662 RepID=A0A426JR45_9PSEU|nr:methyltransferase domain-containing protein [Saccharopolyspora rhizosphaerae]RRO15645.1 methyltransferase domain-containing protein [Saccharopolyspora rhizosphaerae]